ncbi:MAG: adenylate/guanylate cyclase domain-containing protein [Spirochaetia bacterium]|nr:adenylate/guanylate cyclase domain-containing protein [Spirochaetia bacterium]
MLKPILQRISKLVPEDESGIRWTIRLKLSVIISLLVGLSLTIIIFLASFFFRRDNETRIQESNRQLAENVATSVSAEFRSRIQNMRLLSEALAQTGNRAGVQRVLFENDRSLVMLGQYTVSGDGLEAGPAIINAQVLGNVKDLGAKLVRLYPAFAKAKTGTIIVRNLSPDTRYPAAAIAFPLKPQGGERILVAVLRMEDLLSVFQTGGIIKSSLVNEEGTVIAHEDRETVLAAASVVNVPIVKNMRASSLNNGLTRYEYEGKDYWGAFRKLDFGGLGIVTYALESTVFEAVERIERWNFYLMTAVICLAVIFVFFFARGFSEPILNLVGAARSIENGQYVLSLQPETSDEIGLLTKSFVAMGRGLQERENLKVSFGRFVNKELAQMAMSGELKVGGVRKQCTIFFSDIRGFTSISEKLEPEEVVEFLNQYMSEMVKCVQQTHGLVDKFIGDAIMAVWGMLRPHGNDAENAVNSALLMRKQLIKFNKGRGSAKRPIVRIGCGINTGPVIAGQMGSSDKMDFTVIGDAVNTASRVEHLNKTYGTDILITEHTYELVEDLFEVEEMDKVTVRGKTKPVTLFLVLGKKGDKDAPTNVKEVRKLVGIEFSASAKRG